MPIVLLLALACGDPAEPAGPAAPQSHHFIALSADGTRVALVLVEAEGAELLVLESGAHEPLFRASSPDHTEDLPRRHAATLKRYGLDPDTVPVPVRGQWPSFPASAGIIQGIVDTFPDPVPFTIEPEAATCERGLRWAVSTSDDRVSASRLREDCVDDVSLSSVYRGGQTLWFVTGEDTDRGRFVGVAGIPFPR